jgi:transposase-like protein
MGKDAWNIIAQMTKSCDREDCKIQSRGYGMTNSAGTANFWFCHSCDKEWSVRHPTSFEKTTYDKTGKASKPKQQPPEVAEIVRPKSIKIG